MSEQCSTKREVSNDHTLNVLSDQLASLHIGEVRSIRCNPSVAHFDGLSIDDKLELRLNGQPLDLAASL